MLTYLIPSRQSDFIRHLEARLRPIVCIYILGIRSLGDKKMSHGDKNDISLHILYIYIRKVL